MNGPPRVTPALFLKVGELVPPRDSSLIMSRNISELETSDFRTAPGFIVCFSMYLYLHYTFETRRHYLNSKEPQICFYESMRAHLGREQTGYFKLHIYIFFLGNTLIASINFLELGVM